LSPGYDTIPENVAIIRGESKKIIVISANPYLSSSDSCYSRFGRKGLPRMIIFEFKVPELFKSVKRRWVYHLIFWVTYYSWYCYFIIYTTYQIHDPAFYFQIMAFYPVDICLVYFNFYVLIPRLLMRKKYVIYAIVIFLAVFLDACLDGLIKLGYAHAGSKYFTTTSPFTLPDFSGAMAARFYLLGLTSAIRLAKEWIQNQQLQNEREKLYLETELNFLKTQINPHFFFNTLNNLYSLALKRSEQTPEVILKLSDLMSYMLYESNVARVSLGKEINFLQNYLDLEKLRFGNRLTIGFEIEGQMEGVSVPPMILILFAENCFKHGLKDNIDEVNIDIALRIDQGYLFFNIKNPVSVRHNANGISGIGLKNVKRRLDLLFKTDYDLDITHEKGEYIVALKMPV
jgi:sensor histidine kinase YesM